MQAIISCEHGNNDIPEELIGHFAGQEGLLESHRGSDLGASEMAAYLAELLNAPLYIAPFSRLVVDCNRSLNHPGLFSTFTRNLPPLERESVLARYYHPHRQAILQSVRNAILMAGVCLHIGVHTFTPVLHGKERTAEIGLLYDPSRIPEKGICEQLGKALKHKFPEIRIRRNYPYRGVSDGLIPALRKSFLPHQYVGMELELNQDLYSRLKSWPKNLRRLLAEELMKLFEK